MEVTPVRLFVSSQKPVEEFKLNLALGICTKYSREHLFLVRNGGTLFYTMLKYNIIGLFVKKGLIIQKLVDSYNQIHK
jgi:hypothetical protein